jgi:hypothetical protein
MAEKHLTEQGWKALAKKQGVSDSALEKALAKLGQLKEDKLDERLDALDDIKKHATAAKGKNKSNKEVADYLDDLLAEAEKTRRALELERKEAAEEEDDDDEGEDDTGGDLVAALAKVAAVPSCSSPPAWASPWPWPWPSASAASRSALSRPSTAAPPSSAAPVSSRPTPTPSSWPRCRAAWPRS